MGGQGTSMESGWSLGPRLPTPRGGSTSKQRRGGPGSGRWERTRWVLECPCPGGGGGWWQGPGASQRPRHSAGGRAGPGPGWGAGRPTRRRPRFCSSGVTGRREGVGERGDSSPGHRRLWNSVYFHPQQTRRALVAEWGDRGPSGAPARCAPVAERQRAQRRGRGRTLCGMDSPPCGRAGRGQHLCWDPPDPSEDLARADTAVLPRAAPSGVCGGKGRFGGGWGLLPGA